MTTLLGRLGGFAAVSALSCDIVDQFVGDQNSVEVLLVKVSSTVFSD
jgi:hypothetical protein